MLAQPEASTSVLLQTMLPLGQPNARQLIFPLVFAGFVHRTNPLQYPKVIRNKSQYITYVFIGNTNYVSFVQKSPI